MEEGKKDEVPEKWEYKYPSNTSTSRIQVPTDYYEVLENISTHLNISTPQIEVHLYLTFKNKRLSEEEASY